MALREFELFGRLWRVWDVYPKSTAFIERRRFIAPVALERRQLELGHRLPDGWLAFECAETGERRRITPIPRMWELLPVERLRELCSTAIPASRRRNHPAP